MSRILIVDDEESVRKVLGIQIRRMGHEAVEAEDGARAWEKIQNEEFHTIITDLKMPEMDGLELLQLVRRHFPQIPVIMITAHGTIDTAVEAMKRGAFDYVTKPFQQEEFMRTVERAVLSSDTMAKEFQRSRSFLRQEEKIIGHTAEMERVYTLIERVANSSSPVLINGEPGTGKEVVVRLLHDKSDRRLKPMVRAYLSTCPVSAHREYLFGTKERPGWITLAEDGSLYIDEIDGLNLETQAALFEALTTGHYPSPDGPAPVRCRLICASDINLLEKIELGGFRKDLFYALNVVPIYLPPLRERTQDIEPLVDHFIQQFSKKFSKSVSGIDDEALFHLIQYPWPGNIRELENCVEYAVNICEGTVIQKEHLPPQLFGAPLSPRQVWQNSLTEVLRQKVSLLEKDAIQEALRASNGNVLKASQRLAVPPSLLEEKILALKISPSH